jgi:energy-coupling factor transporter ATP-binding protein EcfA2
MNATEKVELTRLLDKIRSDGRTILLIEHDVKLVMGLCNRMTVLDYGKVIAEGLPQDAEESEGDRGISRRRGALMAAAMLKIRACRSTTAASRPSRALTWKSARASS